MPRPGKAESDALAAAILHLNGAGFFPAMLRYLQTVTPFAGIFATMLHPDRPPDHLYDNVRAERRQVVIDDYLGSAYLLDPIYDRFLHGSGDFVTRLRDVAPDRFRRSTYYRRYYGNIDLRDEMAILIRLGSGGGLFYSLGRVGAEPRFAARELAAFRQRLPILSALSARHFGNRPGRAAPGDVARSVSRALDRFGEGLLTAREREVAALILKGHSSASIADLIGASHGTVKIHRKNLYRKLNIASQSELFSAFLGSIGGGARAEGAGGETPESSHTP